MSRGGERENAGRKPSWVNNDTTLIRIPKAIRDSLMTIAKKLDQGESVEIETKSNQIEIESVTESNLDSVTDSIKQIVDRYRKESDAATPKNTRWDNARKLLKELESVLYIETTIESITESKPEEKELVTKSIVSSNETVTNSESPDNDLVTDSKVFQTELSPFTLQSSKLEPLTQAQLADRFGGKQHRVNISKKKQDLAEWSKSKDPDGIAWERREDKKYYPLNV